MRDPFVRRVPRAHPPKRPANAAGGGVLVAAVLGLAGVAGAPGAAAPLHAQAATAAGAVGADEAAERIRASDLRERVRTLAHDSMRGRDTPSPELEKTAAWVEARFRDVGLRPAPDGRYRQSFPLTVVEPGPAERQSLRLEGPRQEATLRAERDFIPVPAGEALRAEGRLVSVPLEDATTDVMGHVVLLPVVPATLQAALARARDFLAGRRAAGVLLVLEASPEYLAGVRRFFASRRVSLGRPDAFPGPVAIVPTAALPPTLAERLAADRPVPPDWSAALQTHARVDATEAWNTIGWLEGSDPELRDELVIFTAHMDHVGVGRPVDGDSIYNGADDNGSGTAAIVELAEAFAALEPRPRRSVVFMTVSGEEQGLLGSQWYAEHPVFPLERTVANINMDMIGRNWRDTVVAIGQEASSLGPALRRVNAAHPELGLTVIDDPWPQERFFFRSDHFNFARRGVPALFFFSGVHEDYHRPSDTPEKLDYEKTARIVRLVFHLGVSVAEADERPEWDPEAYRTVVEGGR